MIKYVMWYLSAPGNMGGSWSEPRKSTFSAANDEAARKIAAEQNRNFSHVLCVYRADSEVKLK